MTTMMVSCHVCMLRPHTNFDVCSIVIIADRESLKENARMQRIHFGMTSEEREDENLQKQEE